MTSQSWKMLRHLALLHLPFEDAPLVLIYSLYSSIDFLSSENSTHSHQCPNSWCYTVYTDSDMLTWKKAQAFCRKHHIDLVTIKDDQENKFFKGPGWIGLYRENASSPWKWSRGDEIVEFTNWDIGGKLNVTWLSFSSINAFSYRSVEHNCRPYLK
uniref:C-type lectin domain-containing protein n=1 Tax=Amphilophus citrinellus TaxID=61819 RepID=A0A3Q0R521_AMPCI